MFKKIWLIFINTFAISLTANSGYAMLGVFKNRFVDKYGWFSKEEMGVYIALAQSWPGTIAFLLRRFLAIGSVASPALWRRFPASFCLRLS